MKSASWGCLPDGEYTNALDDHCLRRGRRLRLVLLGLDRRSIADPFAPSTDYTCGSVGQHLIYVAVSDDVFEQCIDEWIVPATCVDDDGGLMCRPPDGRCSDGTNLGGVTCEDFGFTGGTLASCVYCGEPGSCSPISSGCPGDIDPAQNWLCEG